MRAEYTINNGKIRHMTKYKTERGYFNRFYLYNLITSFAIFDDSDRCIVFGSMEKQPIMSFTPRDRKFYTITHAFHGPSFNQYYP